MENMDKNAFNVAMGKRLFGLRKLNKKSQKYVASKLGVTYQQVHKYETGETQIPPVHLFTYSKMFGVSMAYLYGLAIESNDDMPELDKKASYAALETIGWPDDLRNSFYHLTQQITKACVAKEKDKAA